MIDDLGAVLKQAREERGIAIRDVAERTKISITALEALERNDVSRLPGGIFGRSFVRSYAAEIGLNPETIVQAYLAHLERLEHEAALRGAARPEITADDRAFLERQRRAMRLLRLVIAALLLAGIAGGMLWRAHARRAREVAAVASAVRANDAPSAALPQGSGIPVPTDRVIGLDPSGTDRASSTPSTGHTDATRSTPDTESSAAASAAAVPTSSAPAAAAAPATAPITVDLSIGGDCWVFAASDGQRQVSALFHAGDSRRVTATRELVLDLGDAGAVQWTINGEPGRPLGAKGAHVRVTLEPGTLKQYIR
jgi:cytoskeleton protein RodZ